MLDIETMDTNRHVPEQTPWGPVQHEICISPGACYVSTASHGGLYLTGQSYAALPEPVRNTFINGAQWAEEDCEMNIVLALLNLRRRQPDQPAEPHGTLSEPGQSEPTVLNLARKICETFERYRPCLQYLQDPPQETAPDAAPRRRAR